MFAAGVAAQVAVLHYACNIDILGVSESRWTGAGRIVMNTRETILYVGQEEQHHRGVAIMLSEKAKKFLKPVSIRIICVRFYSAYRTTRQTMRTITRSRRLQRQREEAMRVFRDEQIGNRWNAVPTQRTTQDDLNVSGWKV